MIEDDLREFELAIDTHGALSGGDSALLIAEVRRLRDLLRRYGEHRPGCRLVLDRRRRRCTCGWSQVQADHEA